MPRAFGLPCVARPADERELLATSRDGQSFSENRTAAAAVPRGPAPQVNTRTHSQWGACVVPSLKLNVMAALGHGRRSIKEGNHDDELD